MSATQKIVLFLTLMMFNAHSLQGQITFNFQDSNFEIGSKKAIKTTYFICCNYGCENDTILLGLNQITLDSIVNFLHKNTRIRIEFNVHTFTRRNASYNLAFSKNKSILWQCFFSKNGINDSRVQVMGLGETQPIVIGTKLIESQDEINQRIEIIIKANN
jgi:hypothetical protein